MIPPPSRLPWHRCGLLLAAAAAPALCLGSADERATPVNEKPVEMPPVIVTVTREKVSPVVKFFRDLDNLFQGPFLNVRSGPLIEAIVWRYHFLQTHPQETAVILVDQQGPRVVSATTVYTEDGRLYASSQVVGAGTRLRGFSAADIRNLERIRHEIEGRRAVYLAGVITEEERANAHSIPVTGTHDSTPVLERAAHALDHESIQTSSSPFVSGVTSGPWDLLGVRMARAERSHDYSSIAYPIEISNPILSQYPRSFGSEMVKVDPFAGSADDILRRTYEALHDPVRAGFLPVARSIINFRSGPNGAVTTLALDAVVFDWEGQHYIYNPDRGTSGRPLPRNPLTGRPYLCIKNGDLFESIIFCATYPKVHLDERAVLLAPPGGPYAAAYTEDGALHLFSPFLGRTLIPSDLHLQLEDTASLVRLHALLVERERRELAARGRMANPNSIPDGLPGDDADMQMRRAYLSLTAAGVFPDLITLQDVAGRPLSPERHALTCQWQGKTYTYNLEGPITTSIIVAHALVK